MIITVCVLSAVAGALASMGILRSARKRGEAKAASGDVGAPNKDESAPPVIAARQPAGFEAAVGDVFMSRYGDDLLLVGAAVFSEGSPWGAIFIASDAAGKAVLLRPGTLEGAALLQHVPDARTALGTDVPTTLEWEGHAYARERRVPVNAEVIGEGVPTMSSQAVVHELAGEAGRVAVCVATGGERHLWIGTRLRVDEFEIVAPKVLAS